MIKEIVDIFIYAILWVVTLRFYLKRNREWSVATFIVAFYLIISIIAIISFVYYPGYTYGEISLFPLIYLFCMLLLGMRPISVYVKGEHKTVDYPSSQLLMGLLYFYIILTILNVPGIISNMQEGLHVLLTEERGGLELYNATSSDFTRRDGQITNIVSVFYNFLSPICVFLFFYYLTLSNKKRWIIIMLAVSILVSILDRLAHGQRTGPTLTVLTFISTFFMMKPFLSKKISRNMSRITMIVGIALMIPFLAVTSSRFQTKKGGSIGGIVYYTGQAPIHFDNYCLDAGGIRYGDRTAPEFKRLLGFQNVPKDEPSRREKYPNLKIDAYWFYTYVGDFVLDYGPIATVLIFVVFSSVFVSLIRHRKGDPIPFHKLLLVYFAMSVCVQGGFYLFSYAHYGNYSIMTIMLIYIVFRYDYNRRKQNIVKA